MQDVDIFGDVPAPYNLEKHNLSPHLVIGDFEYDENEKPIVLTDKEDKFIDRRGNPVTRRGFIIDSENNLICNKGIQKLKWGHMNDDNDLPLLYN